MTFSSELGECRYCPECGTDWRGTAIPVEYLQRGLYGKWDGQPWFYSRLVGIYSDVYDRTVEWMCPDCGKRWPR